MTLPPIFRRRANSLIGTMKYPIWEQSEIEAVIGEWLGTFPSPYTFRLLVVVDRNGQVADRLVGGRTFGRLFEPIHQRSRLGPIEVDLQFDQFVAHLKQHILIARSRPRDRHLAEEHVQISGRLVREQL